MGHPQLDNRDDVLTLSFMKYVSDKYAGKPGAVLDIPARGGFADTPGHPISGNASSATT